MDYLSVLSLRWMNGNRADADDALMDAAVRGCQKYPEHAGTITSIRGWLARLLHNVCIDMYRRRGVWPKLADTLLLDQLVHEGLVQRDTQSPEEILGDHEMLGKIADIVDRMPPQQRRIFLERIINDRSYSEIAEQLGTKSTTLRKVIEKARGRLVSQLAE